MSSPIKQEWRIRHGLLSCRYAEKFCCGHFPDRDGTHIKISLYRFQVFFCPIAKDGSIHDHSHPEILLISAENFGLFPMS